MLNKILLLTFLTLINIGIFFGWALVLFPFSPLGWILLPLLFSVLPKNLVSSEKFYGDILPLLILPFVIILNFVILIKFSSQGNRSKAKFFLTNLALSPLPILLALAIVFGPGIIGEKMHEKSVVDNFSVIGEPTFVLEDYKGAVKPGLHDFIMELPVKVNTSFNGAWIVNFFNVGFIPSNEEVVSHIQGCKLSSGPYLKSNNLQPKVPEKSPPGEYIFRFDYSFEAVSQYSLESSSCTQDSFKTLMGKRIELLQTTGDKVKVLKTFVVSSFQIKVYE